MANNIGLSVDIGVSFGIAGMVKAVRVGSVTMGRIDLRQHEAKTLTGPGGHTILKHVGRTDDQLRVRLKVESKRDAVSSFTNLRAAEWAISEVMRANSAQIEAWAKASSPNKLFIGKDVGRHVGRVLTRETGRITDARKVTAIIKRETYNGMPYYILTAFIEQYFMIYDTRYQNLAQIIIGYFNEDFDLFGQTVEEIVACYKRDFPLSMQKSAIAEIDKFKNDNSGNFDFALRKEFGNQFNPKLWGYTVDSFLDELKRLLQE